MSRTLDDTRQLIALLGPEAAAHEHGPLSEADAQLVEAYLSQGRPFAATVIAAFDDTGQVRNQAALNTLLQASA